MIGLVGSPLTIGTPQILSHLPHNNYNLVALQQQLLSLQQQQQLIGILTKNKDKVQPNDLQAPLVPPHSRNPLASANLSCHTKQQQTVRWLTLKVSHY